MLLFRFQFGNVPLDLGNLSAGDSGGLSGREDLFLCSDSCQSALRIVRSLLGSWGEGSGQTRFGFLQVLESEVYINFLES